MNTLKFFFNFFMAISVFACSVPAKVAAVAVDPKQEASIPAEKDVFLVSLLRRYPQYFDSVLKNNEHWKAQIIYTQIDRSADNKPQFSHHHFNVDGAGYYYPASTVKLPVAALALQKLNELNNPALHKNTTMITGTSFEKQTSVYNDATTEDGRPAIAHYIKKILMVSDNDAYNRLYEFLGQEYINQSLHKMGYDSAQILHRLSISMNEEQNRNTNPVSFYDSAGNFIYNQPATKSSLKYQQRSTFMGKGYMSGGKLIEQPFDFSKKNRLTLTDLHSIVQSIIFPEAFSKEQRFNLTGEDYNFLYRHMSMMPRESRFPEYNSSHSDAYVKFLLFGGSGEIKDTSLRIFNKVGDAYGFLLDAAYIIDFKNGVEFMLSAAIYCNSDEVFNDDKYDYDRVGFPFMKNLGTVIYDYELKRTRKNKANLSRYKFNYAQ